MHSVLEQVAKIGIVPVIKIDDVEKAVPLAKALAAGGIPCAEVTFRTAQGEEAIRRIAKEMPEVLLGAGTVLTTEQVDKAIDAGAKFIVSPGFNPKVVGHCVERGIPITPGCSGPSDMEAALEFGLDTVKFFPAEQSGGLEFLKAVSAPYPMLKFMPTGGINEGNIAKYLAFEKIVACGGSWMVKADLIDSGNFDEITRLCKQAVRNMLQFQIAHIGVNSQNKDDAMKAAALFDSLFGFVAAPGNSSVFAGKNIEIMYTPFRGKYGHIGVGTGSVERGLAYLERLGVAIAYDTLNTDAKGVARSVYLAEEIAGFAVHLVKQ